MDDRHVIVVGAGAIGTASAYYLAKSGCRVTLVDRDRQGEGSTSGNCGLLAFSHVLPLNAPGAISKTLQAILRPNSPLSIKLRFDPSLWLWLAEFARCSNRATMLESASARASLIRSSAELYETLLTEELLDCEWEKMGCLFIFKLAKSMDGYAYCDDLLRQHFDLPASRIHHDELIEMEPAIRPGTAAGAWYYAMDAHLRPERLMAVWRERLVGLGVTIREQCRVSKFSLSATTVLAVETTDGPVEGDVFVVTAGACTPLLQRQFGCRIPIQPGKGYSITMPRPSRCPNIPLIFQDDKVAVTPMQTGFRVGSTMEFAGYDATINDRRLDLLVAGASHYLHEPVPKPVENRWFGWRPMTPHGKPVISRLPSADNLFVAAGHNMLGLTMAPATGKLVAELVTGRPPHIDPKPFFAVK